MQKISFFDKWFLWDETWLSFRENSKNCVLSSPQTRCLNNLVKLWGISCLSNLMSKNVFTSDDISIITSRKCLPIEILGKMSIGWSQIDSCIFKWDFSPACDFIPSSSNLFDKLQSLSLIFTKVRQQSVIHWSKKIRLWLKWYS